MQTPINMTLIQVLNLVLDYFNLVTTTITLVSNLGGFHAYKKNWGGIITMLLTLLHEILTAREVESIFNQATASISLR